MKNVISAVCIKCGAEHEATPGITTCSKCGGLLDIKYDYAYIKKNFTKEKLAQRELSMWRYEELLPVTGEAKIKKLRVGWSPMYKADRLAEAIGLENLWVKDDGINPTASLKDRASSMAVVKAAEAGVDTIACSSTGNAASSLAGNSAAAGFKTYIFVPDRAPKGKVAQLMIFGANVITVKGSYEDTFRLSAEAIDRWHWYNRNAAINPYLMEGKKTVALEIAEQFDFKMPEYVAISVGDGCTIAGAWKGFKDLYAIGAIDRLPRLISVQSTGCYPINKAFAENKPLEHMEENTIADSIAVGVPRNADKALNAIRESNGIAVNVTDEEILDTMRLVGRTCGVFGEPAGSAGTAGVRKAVKDGLIPSSATVCTVVTGNGLKDVANAIKAAGEPLNIAPDMNELVKYLKI
ncbi:MAG: threonine synthase [Clostridiales bacterium]|nr:threonine synthase [Clostridiales bacterium]